MKIQKALEILAQKGIIPKAIVKFIKVKLDKKMYLNCIVAYDDKNFYIVDNSLIGLRRDITIQRKDESTEVNFYENIVTQTLLYQFKLKIKVNKRELILEDPIEGDTNKFFEEFALRGVPISKISKNKYFVKKAIKYGSWGGTLLGVGFLIPVISDFAMDFAEEKIKETIMESSDELSSQVVDKSIQKIKEKLWVWG